MLGTLRDVIKGSGKGVFLSHRGLHKGKSKALSK
jgi:hypothetical protein